MVTVHLYNDDTDAILPGLQVIGADVPFVPGGSDQTAATEARYSYGGFGSFVDVLGTGFTYDAAGKLAGGTIASITVQTYGPNDDPNLGASHIDYTGLSLPVADAIALSQTSDPQAVLLAAGATIYSDAASVTGGAGNDLFVIHGPGFDNNFLSPPPAASITTDVQSGGGVDTAAFQNNFLGDAVITPASPGSSGTETVTTASIVANLDGVAQIRFVDGSVFENAATAGGQAALMWLGVFGRTEDAINLGGYAAAAEQSGTAQAAGLMLATAEGQADTAGLTTAQFVTRLYENILHRAPESTGLAGWVNAIDTGFVDRAQALSQFVLSPEAQSANALLFETGSAMPTGSGMSGVLFGANPNGVEVLRAYETLLGRPVEASSLVNDTNNLDSGMTLQDLYASIQNSAEFLADDGNTYGITQATPFAAVYAIAHGAQVTDLLPVSNTGGIGHLAG